MCSIQRATVTTDRSGQTKRVFNDVANNVPCLFLEVSGNIVQGPQEGHQGVFALYLEPGVDLTEGDMITNILDKLGDVIEPGPFYAESVKKVGSHISGRIHHISVKLRGGV